MLAKIKTRKNVTVSGFEQGKKKKVRVVV